MKYSSPNWLRQLVLCWSVQVKRGDPLVKQQDGDA